jgi:hypothetical protein
MTNADFSPRRHGGGEEKPRMALMNTNEEVWLSYL